MKYPEPIIVFTKVTDPGYTVDVVVRACGGAGGVPMSVALETVEHYGDEVLDNFEDCAGMPSLTPEEALLLALALQKMSKVAAEANQPPVLQEPRICDQCKRPMTDETEGENGNGENTCGNCLDLDSYMLPDGG